MLDLREPAVFGELHAAGALNVWIDSPQFAERVAGFVPAGTRLLLTTSAPSDVERAVQALSRVGIDDVIGYLQWGMIDWRDAGLPVETVAQITVHDLAAWHEQEQDVVVIDVREPLEWLEGHIAGAMHVPMFEAVRRAAELPAGRPKAVVCAGGLRSSTTISALKRQIGGPWFNVTGGMAAWVKAGYSVRR
jgi:hydroxyacylglutathione hydrolase